MKKLISGGFFADILLLTVVITFLYSLTLGLRPLTPPDEGRYSEIPREMVASGDYLTPHLNGIKYFEKPPLFYWMQTLSIKMTGLHIWSLRLMTEMMGVLGCLLTYWGGRKLYDRSTGILAATILASATFYAGLANYITLDMTLTTLLTGCLMAFIVGTRASSEKYRRYALWSMYAFAALATLTKGLIGAVFPGMIIFTWICFTNAWKELPKYHLVSGALIFLLISLPWHILVQLKNPEFFHFYFIEQHFLRYLTDYADRGQPIWFFPLVFTLGFFPWTGFVFSAIKNQAKVLRNPKQFPVEVFLILWAAVIFLFYWSSHSQLSPYILPVFSPLAVLTAKYLLKFWHQKTSGITFGFVLAGMFSFMISGFILYKIHLDRHLGFSMLDLIIVVPLGYALSLFIYLRKNTQAGVYCLVATTLFFLILGLHCFSKLETRTVKPLADKLLSVITPNDQIYNYNHYFQDLPFYLHRQVKIVNWSDELTFGSEHQDAGQVLINDQQLFKEWALPARKFMIMNISDYETIKQQHTMKLFLIATSGKNALVSNQEITP